MRYRLTLQDHAAFQRLIDGLAAQQRSHYHSEERGFQQRESEIAATRHLYGQDNPRKRRARTHAVKSVAIPTTAQATEVMPSEGRK